jgi:uncharacterized GH25 family protein
MKKSLLIFSLVLIILSCNQSNALIKEQINHSDSVAINYFKGDGTMDTVVAVKIIKDPKIINQLADFVAQKNKDLDYSCGFDGSLHFFKMNKVIQDVNFGINAAGCQYFYFILKGKSQGTELSAAAKELIVSLKK